MLNYGNIRNERINRLQRKLDRSSEKLKERYSASELSHFLQVEKELQIQKAYKQLEQENGSN